MRRSISALALSLVAALGLAVPIASAAPSSGAKVVIIVGATHGTTDRYRTYANEIYAEAIQHTSNVVRVYSPYATWSAVKAAVVDANVVIYLGHGNGWPSPYTFDPNYTTKDGFGLNATAGNGDHNNKYYGEPYIEDLDFAPNAVVFLHHLCYAAGNSEPGGAAPTLSVAKQRVDNYGSAFLRAGASVVIADGHSHSSYYLDALFSETESLGDLWRGAPNYNGNEIAFDPTRSSGTAVLDPDNGGSNPSSYYRSIVGNVDTMTYTVTGGPVVPSVRGKPGAVVIPNRFSLGAAGETQRTLRSSGAATTTTTVAPTTTTVTTTRSTVRSTTGTTLPTSGTTLRTSTQGTTLPTR